MLPVGERVRAHASRAEREPQRGKHAGRADLADLVFGAVGGVLLGAVVGPLVGVVTGLVLSAAAGLELGTVVSVSWAASALAGGVLGVVEASKAEAESSKEERALTRVAPGGKAVLARLDKLIGQMRCFLTEASPEAADLEFVALLNATRPVLVSGFSELFEQHGDAELDAYEQAQVLVGELEESFYDLERQRWAREEQAKADQAAARPSTAAFSDFLVGVTHEVAVSRAAAAPPTQPA